jgi:hypothetical protein
MQKNISSWMRASYPDSSKAKGRRWGCDSLSDRFVIIHSNKNKLVLDVFDLSSILADEKADAAQRELLSAPAHH